jgi:hypothetical protein
MNDRIIARSYFVAACAVGSGRSCPSRPCSRPTVPGRPLIATRRKTRLLAFHLFGPPSAPPNLNFAKTPEALAVWSFSSNRMKPSPKFLTVLRRTLLGAALAATAVALFVTVENWRGDRAWAAVVISSGFLRLRIHPVMSRKAASCVGGG